MNPVQDLIDKLRRFEQSINLNIRLVVTENEHIILDLNTQTQLYDLGIDRNDVPIFERVPYSWRTVEFKMLRHQPSDRVTLRDEGDFHRSFKLFISDDDFEIYATDLKTEMLVAKYGESILGLTDDNLNNFIWDYVYPELFEKLIEALQ